MSDLQAIITDIETRLAAVQHELGPYDHSDRTWHERRRKAVRFHTDILQATYGAKIRDKWDGARVAIGGIAATCTAGVEGALQNWIAAARRRLEAPS